MVLRWCCGGVAVVVHGAGGGAGPVCLGGRECDYLKFVFFTNLGTGKTLRVDFLCFSCFWLVQSPAIFKISHRL